MPETAAATADQTVGLFVTCLLDSFRPAAGFAAAALIEQAGYTVTVPSQSCCGQANFNGGDSEGTRALALRLMRDFANADYVVVPSASCAAMIRVHYPELFVGEAELHAQAEALAGKTWELTSFLVEVAGLRLTDTGFTGTIVMHDACSALRGLDIKEQPRALLKQLTGCRVQPLANPDVCCGFGGLFCTKYPEVSDRIAAKKLDDIRAAGQVDALVSTDLGCLMHLGGKLHREDGAAAMPVLHIAELLAGMLPEAED